MEDEKLKSYFKFDEGDLQANRHGQFTEQQKARLASDEKSANGCTRVMSSGMILIGLIGLAGAVGAWLAAAQNDWAFKIIFGILFGLVWPLIWGGLGVKMLAFSFAKTEFTVARAQGRVNIVREEKYNSSTHTRHEDHELHLGGVTFDVDEDLADVIMQGDEYIFYYVPGNKAILSAEFVSAAH